MLTSTVWCGGIWRFESFSSFIMCCSLNTGAFSILVHSPFVLLYCRQCLITSTPRISLRSSRQETRCFPPFHPPSNIVYPKLGQVPQRVRHLLCYLREQLDAPYGFLLS